MTTWTLEGLTLGLVTRCRCLCVKECGMLGARPGCCATFGVCVFLFLYGGDRGGNTVRSAGAILVRPSEFSSVLKGATLCHCPIGPGSFVFPNRSFHAAPHPWLLSLAPHVPPSQSQCPEPVLTATKNRAGVAGCDTPMPHPLDPVSSPENGAHYSVHPHSGAGLLTSHHGSASH